MSSKMLHTTENNSWHSPSTMTVN